MDRTQTQAKSPKPFVPKKADFTTVLCFVKRNKIEYTPKDMHLIGKRLADMYRAQYKREPQTVQQIEGRSVIVVNMFPYEFSKHIHKVVNDHFKKRADGKEGQSRQRDRAV